MYELIGSTVMLQEMLEKQIIHSEFGPLNSADTQPSIYR